MQKKNLDLIVVLLIAALNVGWTLLAVHLPVVGIIFALPLVFLLPGYALTEVFFKRTSDDTKSLIVKPHARIISSFPISDRLVFSIGLSVVIDITTGLVLNTLSIGLNQSSWAVALVLVTAVFTLTAVYRRRGVQEQQSKRPGGLTLPSLRCISLYEYTLFVLALAITVSCVWYSVHSTLQQEQQASFTQLVDGTI